MEAIQEALGVVIVLLALVALLLGMLGLIGLELRWILRTWRRAGVGERSSKSMSSGAQAGPAEFQ
jgi:hypothetical protein